MFVSSRVQSEIPTAFLTQKMILETKIAKFLIELTHVVIQGIKKCFELAHLVININ